MPYNTEYDPISDRPYVSSPISPRSLFSQSSSRPSFSSSMSSAVSDDDYLTACATSAHHVVSYSYATRESSYSDGSSEDSENWTKKILKKDDIEELFKGEQRYANDTKKARAYLRLGRFEQNHILGTGTAAANTKSDAHAWLLFSLFIFIYTSIGTMNLLSVIVYQGYWRVVDYFTAFNLLFFGFGLLVVNLMTWLLATVDAREVEGRQPIVLDNGVVIPPFGRLGYDEDRNQFYEVHLLNPNLVRFILYLDYFWILNGFICSLAAIIYWGLSYYDDVCRIITYIYTFVPLPMFILLLMFKKVFFRRMAISAYWPSDMTRERGRFNYRMGEIADRHFQLDEYDTSIVEKLAAATEKLYATATTRIEAPEDQMISADPLDEDPDDQDYKVFARNHELSEVENGKYHK